MNSTISALGWLHTVGSLIALAAAIAVAFGVKGSSAHRYFGKVYVLAMLFTAASSLGIYKNGKFWFPHWLAMASLVITVLAYLAIRQVRHRKYGLKTHIGLMTLSSYLLVGGAINEAFLRIPWLHEQSRAALAVSLKISHSVVLISFAALLVYLVIKPARLLSAKRLPAP